MPNSVARVASMEAVDNLHRLWVDEFARRFRPEMQAGFDEYAAAILGGDLPPEGAGDELAEHMTSLPSFWAAFLRPMADGNVGWEHARKKEKLRVPALASAVEAIAHARMLFGDVVHVDELGCMLVVRDAFDGAIFRVPLHKSALSRFVRWERVLTLVVPVTAGRWHHPSFLTSHAWFTNVSPETLVRETESWLAQRGVSERCEGEPQRWLARVAGHAYGVLMRTMGPTEEERAEAAQKLYCVNDARERYEMHEALLTAAAVKQLAELLPGDAEFSRTESGYSFRAAGGVVDAGRVDLGDGAVVADSVARYEALVTRLEQLTKSKLRLEPAIVRPWEANPDRFSPQPEGAREVQFGVRAMLATSSPSDAVRGVVYAMAEAALDEHIPELGGVPRALVLQAEGRDAVERWLQRFERGAVGADDVAYIDLDPLRRQLGLPTIAEAIARQLQGG